ncbi:MAG: DUF4304 domain-containing protein [Limisphaerales bacterium]
MNHPSDLIDEIVKAQLKPALKELGFKNKSSTFFRQNGDLVEVVSPQKSSWNDAGEAKFTINLGVYWPKVHETLGRPTASSPPKEYDCTLRQRIGHLFDDGKDFWWTVKPDSDIRQIGGDVVEKTRTFALPWLARATKLEEAVTMANTGEAAVFYVMKGDAVAAREVLEKAMAKTKHAKAFLRTLAVKLGLEISQEL